MNRKSVSIVLAFIVLGSALGLTGYFYFDLYERHAKLQSEYNSFVNEYNLLQSNYSGLESDYKTLNDTYRILFNDYTQLNQTHQTFILEYNELNASYRILTYNYSELKQDYSELSTQYASLFNDYTALSEAFNKPLSYEETPSTEELKQWLATDETDEIRYAKPNFVCGDFAVMLSLHAKLEHWDMGVVAVFGHTKSHESFAHAFNAIICGEGLVYVEPQSDEVWWYLNHKEITEGTWQELPDFGRIYVEEYNVILLYD